MVGKKKIKHGETLGKETYSKGGEGGISSRWKLRKLWMVKVRREERKSSEI